MSGLCNFGLVQRTDRLGNSEGTLQYLRAHNTKLHRGGGFGGGAKWRERGTEK